MVIFNKPNPAIAAGLLAFGGEPLHCEGEICLMVGVDQLYGFGLDLTQRELQSRLKDRGLRWERAWGSDSAACFRSFA